MHARIRYEFSARLWQHNSPGGWFFVSLPKEISREIRTNMSWQEEGWGRMKASATIGRIVWDTAIWFDKKRDTYLLPIKADIREKASLALDEIIDVAISI